MIALLAMIFVVAPADLRTGIIQSEAVAEQAPFDWTPPNFSPRYRCENRLRGSILLPLIERDRILEELGAGFFQPPLDVPWTVEALTDWVQGETKLRPWCEGGAEPSIPRSGETQSGATTTAASTRLPIGASEGLLLRFKGGMQRVPGQQRPRAIYHACDAYCSARLPAREMFWPRKKKAFPPPGAAGAKKGSAFPASRPWAFTVGRPFHEMENGAKSTY
jgi:hypothetical protein